MHRARHLVFTKLTKLLSATVMTLLGFFLIHFFRDVTVSFSIGNSVLVNIIRVSRIGVWNWDRLLYDAQGEKIRTKNCCAFRHANGMVFR